MARLFSFLSRMSDWSNQMLAKIRVHPRIFLGFEFIFIGVGIFLSWHLPSPGIGVTFLGFVAAVVTIQGQISDGQKILWMIAVFLLLVVEIRSIEKDRTDAAIALATARAHEERNFRDIGEGIKDAIKQSQQNFDVTMGSLDTSRRRELRHFSTIFEHEESLAASLNGVIEPGQGNTPRHQCGEMGHGDIAVFLSNGNVIIQNRFPIVLLKVHGQNVLLLDKRKDGALLVVGDIRGSDGRIIVRFGKDGYVVNRNAELQIIRPNTSLLKIEDEYGNEVLNANYINSHALELSGRLTVSGHTYPIGPLQGVSGGCFWNSGTLVGVD